MKRRSPVLFIAAAVASLLLLFFLTIVFIPVDEIKGVVVRGLENEGYVVNFEKFRKVFPFGITVTDASIGDTRGTLVKLDRATFSLKLFPLLLGRIVLDADARIGAGELSFTFKPRTSMISFHAEGVRLRDVPLLRLVTDADIQGELFLDGSFTGKGTALRGNLKTEVKQAVLKGIKISGMPLPDASYETIRGMFHASGGKGTLDSLTFQGDGVYIRLKGGFGMAGPPERSPLNLTIELMPKPDFLEKQKLVFLLLAKYRKSPGLYQIPVRGTLANPSVR